MPTARPRSAQFRHRHPRRVSLTLIGILAVLTMISTSCGLPTIPFLAPPWRPDSTGASNNAVLSFEHNPNNDINDFLGYEIFYKLYTVDQLSLIEQDENNIASESGTPRPRRVERYGFVRAVAVSDLQTPDLDSDEKPHLPTTPTDISITYEMDVRHLRADPDGDLFVSWTQGREQRRGFRRRVEDPRFDNTGETKSFWNRNTYSPGDWDIQQMGLSDELESDEIPDTYYIVWYVMSYGIDGTNFSSDLYSEPLRLEGPGGTETELVLLP